MGFLDKVRSILIKKFPPPDEIDLKEEDGVVGVIVSRRFRKMETIARQELLGKLLEKELTPNERKRILVIVAVTPEEKIGHQSI
jgi:hypothetical protein